MAWVVDTCVVLDVFLGDPTHGAASAALLQKLLPQGLVVCPVTDIELGPAFGGDAICQHEFFNLAGLDDTLDWTAADTRAAHAAWHRHIQRRRAARPPRRPVADILIGAFALRQQGLVTRNPDDFRSDFPGLTLRVP